MKVANKSEQVLNRKTAFLDLDEFLPADRIWLLLTTGLLLIGYIGYYLCRNNLSAAFPLLSRAFTLSNSQLGMIAFYSELSYTIGKFINGPLTDRFGGKKFFLLGMVGAILFNILFSQASDLTSFIILWCGCRFFLSMGWGGLSSIISKWYKPQNYGTIMGILSTSFQVGGLVTTLFTGYIVYKGGGWQDLFIYPAGVMAILFILSLFFIKESPPKKLDRPSNKYDDLTKNSRPSTLRVVHSLLKNRVFCFLLLYSFFVTLLRSVFLVWIPKILVDQGLQDSQAIFQSTLFPLLGTVSTFLLGHYTDRKIDVINRGHVMGVMLIGLVLCLILTFCMMVGWPSAGPYLYLPLGLSGFFLLGPYSMAGGCLSLDIGGPELSGSCTGLVDGIGYVGGVLALWIIGQGADLWGWAHIMLLMAAFALCAVGAAFLLGWEMQKKMPVRGVGEKVKSGKNEIRARNEMSDLSNLSEQETVSNRL